MKKSMLLLAPVMVLLLFTGTLWAQLVQWTAGEGGNGHWYEFIPFGGNWNEAQSDAISRGGYLATLTSAAENEFVWSLAGAYTEDQFKLGGYQTDKLNEPAGSWAWVTNEPWVYENWGGEDPNNGGSGDQDYLAFAYPSQEDSPPPGSWFDIETDRAESTGYVLEVNDVSIPEGIPQWEQTDWLEGSSFFDLYASQDMVFARIWDSDNGGRMFLTSDNGVNWDQISSADNDIDILSIVMPSDNSLLAGTWNGFFQSPADVINWTAVAPNGIPADTAIWSVVMIDGTLFAGTTGDIYTSSDNGATWSPSTGIPANARITSIAASGDAIFAGSAGNGVFMSANDGASWTAINSGLTDTYISQLAAAGTKLLAVTLTGVFAYDDNSMSWTAHSSSLMNINCFGVFNNQLFAGTDDSGVYLLVNGAAWASVSSGMSPDTRVWSLAAGSDGIFAGTSSGVWRLPVLGGDLDFDCDVDANDLVAVIDSMPAFDLATFAWNFGKHACQ